MLTGSVSRRVADDLSDVEMLVVTAHSTSRRAFEELDVKPDRLAERIDDALTAPAPLRALILMSELQAEVFALAPSGANVDRARRRLSHVVQVLREAARKERAREHSPGLRPRRHEPTELRP